MSDWQRFVQNQPKPDQAEKACAPLLDLEADATGIAGKRPTISQTKTYKTFAVCLASAALAAGTLYAVAGNSAVLAPEATPVSLATDATSQHVQTDYEYFAALFQNMQYEIEFLKSTNEVLFNNVSSLQETVSTLQGYVSSMDIDV